MANRNGAEIPVLLDENGRPIEKRPSKIERIGAMFSRTRSITLTALAAITVVAVFFGNLSKIDSFIRPRRDSSTAKVEIAKLSRTFEKAFEKIRERDSETEMHAFSVSLF